MRSCLTPGYTLFYSFRPRSEMTEENLKWLENVFRRTVGENGEISLQDFKNIVHSKNVSDNYIIADWFLVKSYLSLAILA